MINNILYVAISIQLIFLALVLVKKKGSDDLRFPMRLLISFSAIALALQLIQKNFIENSTQVFGLASLEIISVIFLVSGLSVYFLKLALHNFIYSANFIVIQTLLAIGVLLGAPFILSNGKQNSQILGNFINYFNISLAVVVLIGIVFALFYLPATSDSRLKSYRKKSAGKIFLASLLLSMLIFFSIPANPAMATATASFCTCCVTLSTHYTLNERRLFLLDCARQAIAGIDSALTEETIRLANGTFDSLGELLGVDSRDLHADAKAKLKALPEKILASKGLPDAKVIERIHNASENEHVQLFNSLLSSKADSDFVIQFASVRTQIDRLLELSQLHFGVDIIGTSYPLMEVLQNIREEGMDSRFTIVYGEEGVGKKLFAKAIHNVRANKNIYYYELTETGSIRAIKTMAQGSESSNQRDTYVINIEDANPHLFSTTLDELIEIQEKNDVVILGTEPISENKKASLDNIKNAFKIKIPALRERPEDIIYQAIWFIDKFSKENNNNINAIEAEALRSLFCKRWYSNTKELFESIEDYILNSNLNSSGVISKLSHQETKIILT